jgi:hypothetical protein
MDVESQSRAILPDELLVIINKLLQQKWRDEYNNVINAINEIMDPSSDLEAKPKYRILLGTADYRQVHRTCYDHIRIASIEPEYEGCNSLLLTPYKLLLSMNVCRCGVYDEYDYRRFHNLQSDLTDAVYDNESDSD